MDGNLLDGGLSISLIADRIAPFVRNGVIDEANVDLPFFDSLLLELHHLAAGGSAQEQQLALVPLQSARDRGAGRVGEEELVSISLGHRLENVDYSSQGASFGPLRFVAVDIVWGAGCILRSSRLQKAL